MKETFIITLFCLISSTFSFAQETIPNQIIVKITEGGSIYDLTSQINNSLDHGSEIKINKNLSQKMGIWLLTHGDGITTNALINRLYSNTQVIHAQLNRKVNLRETVPNDTNYGQQWHHQNIQSELAWDITTGGMTGVGDEIVVCVIEGGNALHPDLQENAWTNSLEIEDNGIDDDGNGYVDDHDGWNVQTNNDAGVFQGGHGTQVMGMVGARGDNELGVVGANWDVKIMSVRGQNPTDEATIIAAYDYPYNMRLLYEETNGAKGAFVVATNASWGINGGNPENSPIWCGIYETLGESGILNCAATSNSNINVDEVGDLPTACGSDYMISVTSTNANDDRASSGYGASTIDLGAPGSAVYTTNGTDGYGSTSGTSFSSPLTAGVIGLLYSAPCLGLGILSHDDPQAAANLVRQVLLDGVDPIKSLEGECVTGGRLNPFNSLQLLLESCNDDACLAPFNVNVVSEDNVNISLEWGSINSEHTFDFRYREVGGTEWNEYFDLTESAFDLGELEWCTEYEYEIRTLCSNSTQTEWAAYPIIKTNGCCVAPDGNLIVTEVIDENSISLEWPGVFAAESFIINYNPVGGTPTEISGITENTMTISGLEACTEYEFTISSSCLAETSQNSDFFTARTKGCGHCIDTPFCSSIHQTSSSEHIDSVSIGAYSNKSGDNGGYVLFEDTDIILNRGNTFQLTVAAGYGGATFGETFTVWLDANQDGEFSDEEIIGHEENTTLLNATAMTPSDALLGNTRLRVSMVYFNETSGPQNPCGQYNWGETEDYCVTIDNFANVEEVDLITSIYPNPVNDILNVSFKNLDTANQIRITDAAGREVFKTNVQSSLTQINTSLFYRGVYFLEILDQGKRIKTKRFIKQ